MTAINVDYLKDIKLNDNELDTGGIGFVGYSLDDYLKETDYSIDLSNVTTDTIVKLFLDLQQSGIAYDNLMDELGDLKVPVKKQLLKTINKAVTFEKETLFSVQGDDITELVKEFGENLTDDQQEHIRDIIVDYIYNEHLPLWETCQEIIIDAIEDTKLEIED